MDTEIGDSFAKKLSGAKQQRGQNCHYAFAGLTNKEISSLTLTTIRNIETTRLRMRKKMNLDPKDDLLHTIREAMGSTPLIFLCHYFA